jgi:hypothetical protein
VDGTSTTVNDSTTTFNIDDNEEHQTTTRLPPAPVELAASLRNIIAAAEDTGDLDPEEYATVLQAAIDENEDDDGDDNSPGDTAC